MDDTQKLLKTIINHQSSVKEELLKEIRSVRTKVDSYGENLNEFKKETKLNFRKVNDRMDKLGRQLAYLEDDAPTREEFDELKEKVEKISKKFAVA